MTCRHCAARLDVRRDLCLDLGTAPPSNAFLRHEQLARAEAYLPLRVVACPDCGLVQLYDVAPPEQLFNPQYPYFSSVAQSWVAHARAYVDSALPACAISADGFVVEVASNDGYLLQFVRQRGIRCLGIEPTASTAAAARTQGINTVELFLGTSTAGHIVSTHGQADLVIANNVLAHVPDINDFVAGIATLLAPSGAVSFEFPHLYELVRHAQFDTIYHEHYSYLSLTVVEQILARAHLMVWNVETLSTHGGSLRVWAQHAGEARGSSPPRPVTDRVAATRALEASLPLDARALAARLQPAATRIKDQLLSFLRRCNAAGALVVGYGAAAKGNTLLNFAGIGDDLLPWVADASPHKQGGFLPGSRIPVVHPEQLAIAKPAFILLLPWNLAPELTASLAYTRAWGARFVTAIPELRVR